MLELGQLDSQSEEFARRNARIVAVSLDDREHTAETQAKFRHLTLISDAGRQLTDAAGVLGTHRGPEGEETAAPTTFIVDQKGTVRAILRPSRYIERIPPEELLAHLQDSE
jgi:peroxiredoxin